MNKSPDKKNTNYFTATNMSNWDKSEFRNGKKNTSIIKGNTLRRQNNPESVDELPHIGAKGTKISSKIEKDMKYKRISSIISEQTPMGKALDYNIKNLIDKTKKKIHERKIIEQFNIDEVKNEDEGEGDSDSNAGIKKVKISKEDSEVNSKDLDEMQIEDIQVVKKGMKIHVKRTQKFNELIDTPFEEILKKYDLNEKIESSEAINKNNHHEEEEHKRKTNITPYNLYRQLILNEYLLEGKIEKEDEEEELDIQATAKAKESEKQKLEQSRNLESADKSAEVEVEESENNLYLEQFKTHYKSDMIVTGTVSIVVRNKIKNEDEDIINPCAISYGNIIIENEDSFEIDSHQPSADNPKALRRNETRLPGAFNRQGTVTSKNIVRKSKPTQRVFMSKATSKIRRINEEENSEENIIKRLIMDIPEESHFYKIIDMERINKEQQEDELLDGDEEEQEEEFDELEEEGMLNLEDIFLDRNIDFDEEIERARNTVARRMYDSVEWSGQDIKINYDPYYARIASGLIGSVEIFPAGIIGALVKIRGYLRDFVKSSFFENLMTVAVAINTIVLALDHHGISKDQEKTLTTMNFYFTMIFISEMGLKVIGLGPVNYLKDKMNYLDGMVVILSIFELAFLSGGGALSAFRAVRIMRTFRVLRVARLLKSMQSMQTIIDVIGRSISSFIYLALLLLLFIFIYALLGMQTYGNKFDFEDGMPRANFSTFNSAFVTAFQIMTMENWQVILYDCMRSSVNKLLTAVYLISWIFIGNFMLLNLFLAILLDSFAEDDEADAEKKKSPEELKQDAIEAKTEFMNKKGEDLILDYSDSIMYNSKINKNKGGGFVKQTKKKIKNDKLMDESFELEDVALKKKKTEIKEKKPDYWGVECQRSFYLFHYKNIFRKICYKMTNHYLFENVVLILIITSSIKLAYDTYIIDAPSSDSRKVVSERLDLFFTFFFLFEALVKCISLGFIQDDGSYLRESWNQLDFFIVVASLFDLLFEGVNIPAIRILRLLRTLRPLRFISHNSDMKLIVTALLESVGHIINVVVVVLMVWLMFAILAVNLFGGKFYYCSIDAYGIDNEEDWRLANGKWGPYNFNFDNVYSAMITLFVVSTLEGWPDIMYLAVDAACINWGPKKNYQPIAAYFFIVFIFIGSFFFLNFFVGVIFLNYEEAQRAEKESWFMTKKELEWVDVMRMIVKAQPDLETTNEPKTKCLKKLHKIVTHVIFESIIMLCIVLNMIQMGLSYEGESADYTLALLYINYVFTSIFIIEAWLKLTAFGFTYFQSSWNIFDFIVVMGSIVDLLLTNMNASTLTFLRVGPQLIRVLRIMRVSRLLRLINKYEGLQALIKTIMFSLPSLLSVFSLLMLIFFIFAILGVFIFNQVKSGVIIDEFVNFNNFGSAMIMCLRVATGEDWGVIMFDTNNTDSDCVPGETWGTVIAPLYFISFIVICSFVMLNLFILAIIQQFDQYYLADDNVISKFEKDLVVFKKSWTKFSKTNKCIKMKDNKLVPFFQDLEIPLGMTEEDRAESSDIHKNIVQMDIRADEEGYVYFNELLYKVMKKTYGIKHIRNKKLADHEATTFMKINKLQEKMSKYLISEEKKAIAVNPFLAIMYYKISFKTWLNLAKKRFEKEAINDNMAGSEQSNEDISDSDEELNNVYEASVYSFKTFEMESCDSSSAHLGSENESSFDSGNDTIIEHEAEENDKDNPDASYDKIKGKRLFIDDEESKEDEKKDDEVHSENESNKLDNLKEEKLVSKNTLERRKSSAPENIPMVSPRFDIKDDRNDLKIIEENKNEQTISADD